MFFRSMKPAQLEAIECVAMDMWGPFIASASEMVPAKRKIGFDKFHVASHFGDAVDRVRRAEHRALLVNGEGLAEGHAPRVAD